MSGEPADCRRRKLGCSRKMSISLSARDLRPNSCTSAPARPGADAAGMVSGRKAEEIPAHRLHELRNQDAIRLPYRHNSGDRRPPAACTVFFLLLHTTLYIIRWCERKKEDPSGAVCVREPDCPSDTGRAALEKSMKSIHRRILTAFPTKAGRKRALAENREPHGILLQNCPIWCVRRRSGRSRISDGQSGLFFAILYLRNSFSCVTVLFRTNT